MVTLVITGRKRSRLRLESLNWRRRQTSLISLTVKPGNVNGQEHFRHTYDQVRSVLNERHLVVLDKGARDKRNFDGVVLDRDDCLTSKKLNISDDKVFATFNSNVWEVIDASKRVLPSRVNYYFFSEKLNSKHLASRRRNAECPLAEARSIQDSLDGGRKLPKRFRMNNPLADVRYNYQTKLAAMDEKAECRLLFD